MLDNIFATKTVEENIIVSVSHYSEDGQMGRIAIFMPAKFLGMRFSCVWDKDSGVFLLSRDDTYGCRLSKMETQKGDRCVTTFSVKKWFPDLKLPPFNSYRQVVLYSDDSFEIKMAEMVKDESKKQPVLPLPSLMEILPPPDTVQEYTTGDPSEDHRKTALRYVSWLNSFCKQYGYKHTVESNHLSLDRNDRIG